MSKLTKYGLLTISLNLLIIVGMGHGAIFFVFIEYFAVENIFTNAQKFSILGSHEERLPLSGLISLIGQIILAVSLLLKNATIKIFSIYLSIIILLFSFVILVSGISVESIDGFTFLTGIPFIIAIVLLTVSNIKLHKQLSITK